MSDEDPKPKLDIAIPIGKTEEGNPIVARLEAEPGECPTLSVGRLQPVESDSAMPDEMIRLHPTEGPHFRVETIHSSRTRLFPTKAYSEGWERVFGSKRKPKPEEIN